MKEDIKILIRQEGSGPKEVTAPRGAKLLDILYQNDYPILASCGGAGRCNTCVVEIQEDVDKKVVHSCQYDVECDIEVLLPAELIPTDDRILLTGTKPNKEHKEVAVSRELGIAIDIGTTTIGFALIHLKSGNRLKEYGVLNGQRLYGADVSSRILYASDEKGLKTLRTIVCNDIIQGIKHLTKDLSCIKEIAIAANTTMLHILQGLNPKSLGEYPFCPVDTQGGTYSFEAVFQNDMMDCVVHILPCASAYIGADLTVGAGHLDIGSDDQIQLLLDLGTNGEMILGNQNKLMSTSTAAGPAFESSFKSNGVKSTRLIDLLALARRRGFIDKTGLLAKRYFDSGIPFGDEMVLHQQTVREIQLAKSAICTGIELLIEAYGIEPTKINRVYLAGGFGFSLSIENAVYIGLLPKYLKPKLCVAGNTSLLGAISYLTDPKVRERTKFIADNIDNIDLANETRFQELYLTNMNFR